MLARWSETRWNIFARELEDILKTHGFRLGQLDDIHNEYGGRLLHSEKVRRLQHSLRRPVYPMLNPQELDSVIEVIGLSMLEQLRLRAAMIATPVERELAKTLGISTALQVASDVFEMCLASMREQSTRFEAIRAITLMEEEPRETATTALTIAIQIIQDTDGVLNKAQSAVLRPLRILNAQVAVAFYSQALSLLDLAERYPETKVRCQFWREVALKSRARAEELML